jgi:hypothetical protein
MKPFNNFIVEDINSLYNSIYNQQFTEEDQEIIEDIISVVSTQMFYEGYSAKAVFSFLENASEEEILHIYENFDESIIAESTVSEDYVEEQIKALNESWARLGALGLGALRGLRGAATSPAAKAAAQRAATAAGKGFNAATTGAKPILKGLATKAGKYGTIGAVGLGADELLTRGAGRELVSKGLEQSRKLGPALKGEPTSDTAKPTPSDSSDSEKAPSELKGVQVLARKGGVEGVLDKETGEWKAGKWDETQSKRYEDKKKNESYDIVLDYLFNNGHVNTLDEAHYVMLEMDADTIQSIVEEDEFELWVNSLIEEGYDLSDYTWDEMYEIYEKTLHEDAKYDRNRKRAAQRAAARNEARRQGKTGNVPGVGYVSPRPERETYTDSSGTERHKSGARMPKKD